NTVTELTNRRLKLQPLFLLRLTIRHQGHQAMSEPFFNEYYTLYKLISISQILTVMMNNKQFLYTVVILCCGLFFTSCSKGNTTITTAGSSSGNAPVTPSQQLLLDLVNDARTTGHQCGNVYYPPVPEVSWNTQLEDAAKKHSEYMNSSAILS